MSITNEEGTTRRPPEPQEDRLHRFERSAEGELVAAAPITPPDPDDAELRRRLRAIAERGAAQ